ncbi:hypothetical protein [Melghirimyces algeriensis]|uniref:hypothetical protein n=1 Tax=Melghirimyces algeriensis TaxID=910412 RepID=UPI00115A299A|nr:hypothetical protein [Melghirimyces algeriensis]
MPFKYPALMIAFFSILLSSGCSLMAKQMIDDTQKQLAEEQKEKTAKKASKEEQSPEEDEEPKADFPNNADAGLDSGKEGLVDTTKLEASNVTIFADNQNWKQIEHDNEEGYEYTAFTPDGRSSDLSQEMLGVQFFEGAHQQITVAQAAQVYKQEMQNDKNAKWTWNVISETQDEMLVELKIMGDPEQGEHGYGYVRFFTTDKGICALLYLSSNELSEEEQKKWQSLLQRADREDTTL